MDENFSMQTVISTKIIFAQKITEKFNIFRNSFNIVLICLLLLHVIVNKIQTNAVLISSYFLIFVENSLKLQLLIKKNP